MAGGYAMAHFDRAHETDLIENMGDAREAIEEMLIIIDKTVGYDEAICIITEHWKELHG